MKGIFERIKKFLNIENSAYAKGVIFLLLFTLVFGLVSIFTRHPMSWFDEQVHYARVLTLANDFPNGESGQISQKQQEFINSSMGKIAQSLSVETPEIVSPDWDKDFQNYDDQTALIKTRDHEAAKIYTAFIYSPYIATAWIGKALSISVPRTFLMMRLAGFITVFVMFLLAIKISPRGKLAFAIVGVIPPVMLSFSAISADTLTYGFIFLFVASALKLYGKIAREEEVDAVELILFAGISLGVVLSKMPSFLILALYLPILFMAKQSKKIKKKQLYFLTATLFLCAAVTIVWYMGIRNQNANVTYYGRENVDQVRQLQYIFSHPVEAMKTIFGSLFGYPFLDLQLGYADSKDFMFIPPLASIFAFVAFIISFFINDGEQEAYSKKHKLFYNIFSWLIFFGIVVMIFLIFYLQNSDVGSREIVGVQARYFLPFILLLIPLVDRKIPYNFRAIILLTGMALVPLVYYFCIFAYQLVS